MPALGEVLGLDVFQFVGEQARGFAGAVDAFQPVLDLVQVLGLRRDHQHGVGAFQRHEAEHAGTGRLAGFAEYLLQVRHDLAGATGLQREHAHRHARQPVDIEDLDRAQVVFQLAARAREGDEVAGGVDADDGIGAGVGLQHLLHLACGDETQRHHAHFETARTGRRTGARRQRARQRLVGRHDVVAAVAVDHARVVLRQHLLQQAHRLRRRHILGRAQSHRALDAGCNDILLSQHVAKDRLDHRVHRLAFEIELRSATGCTRQRWHGRRRGATVDHLSAAATDHRLRAGFGHVGLLQRRGLRACGRRRRIGAACATHVRRRHAGTGGQQAGQHG